MNTAIPFRAVAIAALVVMVAACGRSDPAAYVASARSYLAKSNYEAAIIELKNALKEAPNHGDARFLLAQTLLEKGSPAEAEVEARKALALKYPADAGVPLLLRTLLAQGAHQKIVAEPIAASIEQPRARAEIATIRALAYLALGERKAAREAVDAALAAEPGNVAARIAQARLAASENNLPRALVLVDAVLASTPDHLETLVLKAELQSALGRRDAGIAILERAVELHPASAVARLTLMGALINATRLAEAEKHLAVAKKIAPNDPRTWHAEALVAFSQDKLIAARDAVRQARRLGPQYLPSVYLSGLIDLRLGSYAAAEEALRAVVLKAPGDEGARRALASAYLSRGKGSQALEALDPLLVRAPNDPALLRMVAEVYLAMNNPGKAAELFAKANTLDTDNVQGSIRLAQVRLVTGDAARALKDLEALARGAPSLREPDLALISAHLQRKELNKALAAAAVLEKKQPANAGTHNVKGVVYMAMGDYKNARGSFATSLTLDPDYVAAEFNLARLDLIDRNFDRVRKRYEGMLAKDPNSESVLLALAELLVSTKAAPAEIKAAIKRALAANPNSVPVHLALISYNGHVQDWKVAVAAALAADVAVPDDPQIVEALGMMQNAAGESNQAIATFKRLSQLRPDNPAPLLRLAELLARAKDYDGSLATLRTGLARQPDAGSLWVAMAVVFAAADRLDTGLAEARKLQKERPDRAVGFALEGELLAQQKNWLQAAIAYRSALTRQASPFVVGRLHAMLQAGGKSGEAAALAQRWLTEHPSDMGMRTYLADQSLSAKDYRGAVQQLRGALGIEPDNFALVNNLAWALGELGEPEAVDHAARAYALAPNNAATADTYGWILVRRGDIARGVTILRQAVELDPADAGKRLRLAQALLKMADTAGARKELETLTTPKTPPDVRAQAQLLLKAL